MTTCGALSVIASSIRTKSPAELVTTADRMALAPLGTPTKDGVSLKSDGISHAVVEHSSTLLALIEIVLRAVDVGTNASVARGDHAAASAAMELKVLINGNRRPK